MQYLSAVPHFDRIPRNSVLRREKLRRGLRFEKALCHLVHEHTGSSRLPDLYTQQVFRIRLGDGRGNGTFTGHFALHCTWGRGCLYTRITTGEKAFEPLF